MTEAYTILRALRTEVEDRIVDVTPTYNSQTRFTKISSEVSRKEDVLENVKVTRAFRLGQAEQINEMPGYEITGTGSEQPAYDIPLEIVYPTDQDYWREVALDDFNLIRTDLANNRGGEPAGVQGRWVSSSPVFEQAAEDPFEKMTFNIRTWLNVTR